MLEQLPPRCSICHIKNVPYFHQEYTLFSCKIWDIPVRNIGHFAPIRARLWREAKNVLSKFV